MKTFNTKKDPLVCPTQVRIARRSSGSVFLKKQFIHREFAPQV